MIAFQISKVLLIHLWIQISLIEEKLCFLEFLISWFCQRKVILNLLGIHFSLNNKIGALYLPMKSSRIGIRRIIMNQQHIRKLKESIWYLANIWYWCWTRRLQKICISGLNFICDGIQLLSIYIVFVSVTNNWLVSSYWWNVKRFKGVKPISSSMWRDYISGQ